MPTRLDNTALEHIGFQWSNEIFHVTFFEYWLHYCRRFKRIFIQNNFNRCRLKKKTYLQQTHKKRFLGVPRRDGATRPMAWVSSSISVTLIEIGTWQPLKIASVCDFINDIIESFQKYNMGKEPYFKINLGKMIDC